jgi:hypothetical protein
MPNSTNGDREDTLSDAKAAQGGAESAACSSAATALGHGSNMDEDRLASGQRTIEIENGENAIRTIIDQPEAAPAACPPDTIPSDQEVGAFDDSHLQIDQSKKKKKKKGKNRKSASKRGLVCKQLIGLKSTDQRSYRALLLGSRSTVQMLQSPRLSTMRIEGSMTCKL